MTIFAPAIEALAGAGLAACVAVAFLCVLFVLAVRR